MTGPDASSRAVPGNRLRVEVRSTFAYAEILAASLLCALAIGTIYSLFVRGENYRQVGIELAEATQNARTGVDLASRELRLAGIGLDPAQEPAILTASQYRVTFALDMNGNHRIDPGETVTYFLDSNRNAAATGSRQKPCDFVLRRKVSTVADPLADPLPGTGEIVAYGLSQRSAGRVPRKNVPLFSYRGADLVSLELMPGTLTDPAGIFYGQTVRDPDLGKPAGGGTASRVTSILMTLVTETRQKNPASGTYDRVSIEAPIGPLSLLPR